MQGYLYAARKRDGKDEMGRWRMREDKVEWTMFGHPIEEPEEGEINHWRTLSRLWTTCSHHIERLESELKEMRETRDSLAHIMDYGPNNGFGNEKGEKDEHGTNIEAGVYETEDGLDGGDEEDRSEGEEGGGNFEDGAWGETRHDDGPATPPYGSANPAGEGRDHGDEHREKGQPKQKDAGVREEEKVSRRKVPAGMDENDPRAEHAERNEPPGEMQEWHDTEEEEEFDIDQWAMERTKAIQERLHFWSGKNPESFWREMDNLVHFIVEVTVLIGDSDWREDLHLGDLMDKHIVRWIADKVSEEEEEMEGVVNFFAKDMKETLDYLKMKNGVAALPPEEPWGYVEIKEEEDMSSFNQRMHDEKLGTQGGRLSTITRSRLDVLEATLYLPQKKLLEIAVKRYFEELFWKEKKER